jgi:hypothetical protein
MKFDETKQVILMFSKDENQAFVEAEDKTKRNKENEPNRRRVVTLLFRPGSQIVADPGAKRYWPEGLAALLVMLFMAARLFAADLTVDVTLRGPLYSDTQPAQMELALTIDRSGPRGSVKYGDLGCTDPHRSHSHRSGSFRRPERHDALSPAVFSESV